jgi:outer membrane protein insertion porin family
MAKSALFGICLIGLLLLDSAAFAQQSTGTTIERIDIRGNRRIPEETIRYSILSRPGEPYDENSLGADLQRVYATNYFEYIEIQERDGDTGKIITFVLKEKPQVRSLEYTGNKSFTESNILDAFKEEKIGLTVDSRYDPSKIRAAERVLKDLMIQGGKPLGTVHSEIDDIPPANVKVRFIMDEGPKVRIGKIRFIGNKIFDDGDLKGTLDLTKERNIFTLFKGKDKYHKAKLDHDIEVNLKAYYQSRGYVQVQVGEPVVRIFEGPRGVFPMLRKTRQQFLIEIPVDAGDQYRLGTLELKNCGVLPCEVLVRSFGMKEGDIINYKQIKDTLENFKKLYGNIGYINYSHEWEPKVDPEKKIFNLTINLEPDKQFYVRRINFMGNTKTRDKVMRREFRLEEGKVFSSTSLEQSIFRLNQLGFFEPIEEKDYEVKPDEKNSQVDVDIRLKEKSQQSIGFSGGVSGISGSFIGLNYSTNNFLGRGETLDVSITAGTRTANFTVSYTKPYFLDTRWNMGLSLFSQRYRYDTYTSFGLTNVEGDPTELFRQHQTGTTVNLSRRLLNSFWTVGTSYTFQNISISNIAPGFEKYALSQFTGVSPSSNPEEALQGIIRSEITPTMNYNSTDAYFNPRRGTYFHLATAVAGGILAGDFKLFRPVAIYRHYFPDRWLSRGRNVFAFSLRGEYIQSYGGSIVPFFDRYYIGGDQDYMIRGFDIRSISPIAVTSTPLFDHQGNPIIDNKTGLPRVVQSAPFPVGGDTVGIINAEYRIAIVGPLSMSAFYDMGINRASRMESFGDMGATKVEVLSGSNNKIRGSTGVEIQFILPVVSAPFRLIFAYNPQRLEGSLRTNIVTYHIKEPSSDIKFTVGRSF